MIENHPADSRVQIAEDNICQALTGRIDASYYKGQGFRQGTEREYIVVISKSERKSDGKRIKQIGYAGSDERYVCDTE